MPHLQGSNLTMQLNCTNLIIFFGLAAALVMVIKLLLKIFRIHKFNPPFLTILSCILGAAIKVGSNLTSRIIYLILIVLSFYTANDFVDVATDFELGISIQSVENLEQLDKMNLPIYSRFPYDCVFGNDTNNEQLIKNLRRLSYDRSGFFNCAKDLNDKGDRICHDVDILVAMLSAILKKKYHRGLRIAKFVPKSGCGVVRFPRNSPYVDEYDRVSSVAHDVGLLRRRTVKQYLASHRLEYDNEDYDVMSNSMRDFYCSLIIVTNVLYCGGVAVLILEIFVKNNWIGTAQHWMVAMLKEGTAGQVRKKFCRLICNKGLVVDQVKTKNSSSGKSEKL